MSHSAGIGSGLVRDEEFYIKSVIFQAEKTLFRVPAYALPTEDGVFSAMFALPNGNGEGSSEDNPIRLPNEVTAEDFRCFLKARIPMPDATEPPKLTFDQWMSVLKLATVWCLDGLRSKAIDAADKELPTLSGTTAGDVYKVLLGQRHRVSRWLLEGYEALGGRKEYLSATERQQLGSETSLRISELREMSWAWAHNWRPSPFGGSSSAQCHNRSAFDYRSSIHSLFADELSLDPSYIKGAPGPVVPPSFTFLNSR